MNQWVCSGAFCPRHKVRVFFKSENISFRQSHQYFLKGKHVLKCFWYLASKTDQHLLLSYMHFTWLLSSHQSLEILFSLDILLMLLSFIPFQSCEGHNRIMLASSRPYRLSQFRLTINQKIHGNSSNPITIRLLNSFSLSINLWFWQVLIARMLLRHIFKVGSCRIGLTLKNHFSLTERYPKAILDISSVGLHTHIWGNQVSFSFIFCLLFAVEEWF